MYYGICNVYLNGIKYKVLIADTDQKRTLGLMFRNKLPNDIDGMLFKFNEACTRSIWNKNTFMDLDVYWILNGTILQKKQLPSIYSAGGIVSIKSPTIVNTIIEIVR